MSSGTVIVEGMIKRGDRPAHTPAYKIWHYTFICMIAQMHLVTTDYLEAGGSITSGNPAIDRQLASNKVQAKMTVAAMSEYLAEGASFHLVELADSAKIYQMIFDHLNDWKRQLEGGMHFGQVPVEELRKLDALATEIYPQARFYFRQDPFHGKLFSSLNDIVRSRGGMRRDIQVAPHKAQRTPLPGPEMHTPLADSITRMATEKRAKKPWG